MDVRRLLARLAAGLVSAFRGTHAGDREPEVQGRVATAGSIAQRPSPLPPGSMSTWLADGRRLRIQRTVRSRHLQGDHASQHTALPIPTEIERQRANPAISRPAASVGGASPNEATFPQVLAAPTPTVPTVPLQPVSALPPDILVDFTGELSAATLEAIEGMDTTQRRLIFLRYLVRQGIYNEGFVERRLPEQYWRSRGVTGPSPEN
jgi:hypothetical protein